jgi:hypothetical protein
MSDDDLRYDKMVEEALRSVVGRALSHVAAHGLPGEHHFYITFRTNHPGAVVPPRLRERYPSEMTIVLQHQFWDLEVGEDGFSVTLSFGEVPERLSVPFDAVAAFADPSVRFGLQFDVGNGVKPDEAEEPGETAAAESEAAGAEGEESEKVVTLENFRKKST